MPARILVVGSANQDLVVRAERIPVPGETVLGGEFVMAAGGKGANQAAAAARLGGEVAFAGKVGADAFGDALRAALEASGVDVAYLGADPLAATGVALIGVDAQGQNAIIVAPGANHSLLPEEVEAALNALQPGVVVAQLEIPVPVVEHAFKRAAAIGALVILNPAPVRHTSPLPSALLRHVNVLTPNEHEAANLLGLPDPEGLDLAQAAERLRDLGPETVIITMGRRGCLIATAEGVRVVEAPQVQAVDTTAAGDCFTGALAVALGEGLSIEHATQFAVRAASISVTRMGAQPSLPWRQEIDETADSGAAAI